MRIARVTLSDRAATGVYADESGPEIEQVAQRCFAEPLEWTRVLLPDDRAALEAALCRLADEAQCPLILTTGGTGPAPRDITPEATRAVLEKELPGFGEIMRLQSYAKVPTAILSRATAGVRGRSLIVNLPGRPRAIGECLPLLVPAIAEALDHIAGFRPALTSPPA
ncbi:molybdopterin adenylyltransferase [Opitutus sp. GAS368]|jgi:molybdopterin adenylyltransferase|uniref:molybdopterin adenylyltransferase n=1 Tax=Opitutus sp. GAS368 TaxID=1882749 RepID=UPI00087AA2D1|nr:molybdopterin adenylyltransferase [Opitutus sp. GAS368]SDS19844.1 molybdopterin adenylyltransferase [Opitutus sp. GAS368]